ncbi:MAG: hypothetical protein LBS82_03370 [Spirochaetaceae bacterium]|jgi:hypothetical protein|nr:hypothetical protein [Spirochaetaceae bacterium]
MKKTNCFLKDGLKRALQTACGLSLLLAASLFSGCATGGPGNRDPNATPGSLTVSGIPANYEGQFAQAEIVSTDPDDKSLFQKQTLGHDGELTLAVGDETVVRNGEVALPLYDDAATSGAYLGYTGSDSRVVKLSIGSAGFFGKKRLFVFKEKVTFANGAAKASFNDSVEALTSLTITITGVPSEYYNESGNERIQIFSNASSFAGNKPPKGTFIRTYGGIGVTDGLTISLNPNGSALVGTAGVGYYTGGPIDVGITATAKDSVHNIVFRGVVFTDGKATVPFQQGVKLSQTPLPKK